MNRRRRIRAAADGGFDIRLPAEERALVATLPVQLVGVLATLATPEAAGAPIPEELRRLFPVAYPRNEESEALFRAVAGDELLAHHRESLALLVSSAQATHLDAEELEGWLTALNDLRLVLGTALGVTEDHEFPTEDDPRYGEWVAYDYLGLLVSEVVDALTGVLPPPVPGADDDLPDDPWGEAPGGLRWDGTPRPGT